MNETSTLLTKSESLLKRYQRKVLFSQLKHGFEIAQAFKIARDEVLTAIGHIDSEGLESIRLNIEKDLDLVRTALLDVQRIYNEIAASISTSLAARTVLNKQRRAIFDLHQEGLLDSVEHRKLTGLVEYQMKSLTYHPPIIEMPNKKDILKQIPWLEGLDSKELSEIASSFEDAVFQRGDVLVKQNEKSDSVHVLARGTVAVSYLNETGEKITIDELGMGSVFGEIAWALNNGIRGASIVATCPGLLFSISGSVLRNLAESNKQLETKLWETCGRRLSENALAVHASKMSRRHIREMVEEFELHSVDPSDKTLQFYDFGKIVLLRGTAITKANGISIVTEAPNVLPSTTSSMDTNNMTFEVAFSTDAKFMCHRFAVDGDTSDASFQINDKRISLAELEIKRTTLSRNCRNGLDLRQPGRIHKNDLDLSLSTAAKKSASTNRRYSLQLEGDASIGNLSLDQNRRSTLHGGSMLTSSRMNKKKLEKLSAKVRIIEDDQNEAV